MRQKAYATHLRALRAVCTTDSVANGAMDRLGENRAMDTSTLHIG
jgi:hypothetical protein